MFKAIIQAGYIQVNTIVNHIKLWVCITLLHEIHRRHVQQIHILIFNLKKKKEKSNKRIAFHLVEPLIASPGFYFITVALCILEVSDGAAILLNAAVLPEQKK